MNENKIKNQKNILQDMLVILLQLVVLALPFVVFDMEGKQAGCILSFVLNGILFSVGIFMTLRRYAISIELVYWVFMFFFMYFAPLIQYTLSTYPWRGYLVEQDILTANRIILIFNLFFILGKWLAGHVRLHGIPDIRIFDLKEYNLTFRRGSRRFFTALVFLLAAYSFSQTGLEGMIVARVQATQVFYSGNNSAIELLVESIIPAVIAYTVAEAAQSMKAGREGSLRFVLLFICMLVCCFPTSLPRYKMITMYGSVFLILFPMLKKGTRFYWAFVLGLFFVFPILNGFRHMLSMENLTAVFVDGILPVYTEADYDAYRMLHSAIEYTQIDGCVWGRQLLGALLFFVPRSLWSTKPGGSGAMLIRNEFGRDVVSNVSCPYIAEGYLNFGMVGIFLFAVVLGILICRMDREYWTHNFEKSYMALSPYLYVAFMMFFLLRGDLMSGFAYLCGYVVTGYGLKILARYI